MPFEPLPLNEETLIGLLNEGTERPGLDYKRSCDLNRAADRVELAKDFGAMQIRGGYIVIGADDNGRPTSEVTDAHARLFDQATLQSKLGKYLAEGFDIRSTALTLDGQRFGLICVLPHRAGFAPFRAAGNYERDGCQQQAFRAGDVFARHGTSSEPWNAEDVRDVREEIRRQEREAARAELQDVLLTAQTTADQAARAAAAPTATLSWRLDLNTLTAAITEQLRSNDDIPLTSLLKSAPGEAAELARDGQQDELDRLLDDRDPPRHKARWAP